MSALTNQSPTVSKMDTSDYHEPITQTWNSTLEKHLQCKLFLNRTLTVIIKYGEHQITDLFRQHMFAVDNIAASKESQHAVPEALGEVIIIEYAWMDSFNLFARDYLAEKVDQLIIYIDTKPQEIFYGTKILELIRLLYRQTRLSFWMEPKVIENKELLQQFYIELCEIINHCHYLTRLEMNLSPDDHEETTALPLTPIMHKLKFFSLTFNCTNTAQLLSAAVPGNLSHLGLYLGKESVKWYKDETYDASRVLRSLTSLGLLLDNYEIEKKDLPAYFEFFLDCLKVRKLRVEAFKPVDFLNPLVYELFGKIYLRLSQLQEIILINIFVRSCRENEQVYVLTNVKRVTIAVEPTTNFFDHYRYLCRGRRTVIMGPFCRTIIYFFANIEELTVIGCQEDHEDVIERLMHSYPCNMERTYKKIPTVNIHIRKIKGSPWNNDPL